MKEGEDIGAKRLFVVSMIGVVLILAFSLFVSAGGAEIVAEQDKTSTIALYPTYDKNNLLVDDTDLILAVNKTKTFTDTGIDNSSGVSMDWSVEELTKRCLDIHLDAKMSFATPVEVKLVTTDNDIALSTANNARAYKNVTKLVASPEYQTTCELITVATYVNGSVETRNDCTTTLVNSPFVTKSYWEDVNLNQTLKNPEAKLDTLVVSEAGDYRYCIDIPLGLNNGRYGSTGTVYVQVNGNTYADFQHSSFWNQTCMTKVPTWVQPKVTDTNQQLKLILNTSSVNISTSGANVYFIENLTNATLAWKNVTAWGLGNTSIWTNLSVTANINLAIEMYTNCSGGQATRVYGIEDIFLPNTTFDANSQTSVDKITRGDGVAFNSTFFIEGNGSLMIPQNGESVTTGEQGYTWINKSIVCLTTSNGTQGGSPANAHEIRNSGASERFIVGSHYLCPDTTKMCTYIIGGNNGNYAVECSPSVTVSNTGWHEIKITSNSTNTTSWIDGTFCAGDSGMSFTLSKWVNYQTNGFLRNHYDSCYTYADYGADNPTLTQLAEEQNGSSGAVANNAPSIINVKLNMSNDYGNFTNQSFTLFFNVSDNDAGANGQVYWGVDWFLNGARNTSFQNWTEINYNQTTRGDNFTAVIWAYDRASTPLPAPNQTTWIHINNAPPVWRQDFTFNSSNAFNYTNGTIQWYGINSSTNFGVDIDNDSIPFIATWYFNGSFVPNSTFHNLSVIGAGNLTKNQNWTVYVYMLDQNSSSENRSASIIIRNAPPNIVTWTANVSDVNNFTNGSLAIYGTFLDVDTRDTVTSEIAWRRNGTIMSTYANFPTLNHLNTTKFQTWNATILAFDGEDRSGNVSWETIIRNTPPNISFFLYNTSNYNNYTNGSLNFYNRTADQDGDQIYEVVTWLRNGTAQSSLTNLSNIAHGNTTKYQNWTVVVYLNDGNETTSNYSESIVIQNAPPDLTTFVYNSTSLGNYSNSSLNVYTLSSDIDVGDTVYRVITWQRNGTVRSGLTNFTEIIRGNLTKYQNWSTTVYLLDNDNLGSGNKSASITLNDAPVEFASLINITPRTADVTNNPNITIEFNLTDADNDTITSNLTLRDSDGIFTNRTMVLVRGDGLNGALFRLAIYPSFTGFYSVNYTRGFDGDNLSEHTTSTSINYFEITSPPTGGSPSSSSGGGTTTTSLQANVEIINVTIIEQPEEYYLVVGEEHTWTINLSKNGTAYLDADKIYVNFVNEQNRLYATKDMTQVGNTSMYTVSYAFEDTGTYNATFIVFGSEGETSTAFQIVKEEDLDKLLASETSPFLRMWLWILTGALIIGAIASIFVFVRYAYKK